MSELPTLIRTETDAALLYACRNGGVQPEILTIFNVNTRTCSESEAAEAFLAMQGFAENGIPIAMCFCSRFYRSGWGVEASNAAAFDWARQASDSGFAPGCYELGRCYEDGTGIDKNLTEACRLFELAVERGFGFAAMHLATLYHTGALGATNFALALEWAVRAYELNESLAPLVLGRWFEEGEGVTRNEKTALQWYERSSRLGNSFASARLSLAYALGGLSQERDDELAQKYEALSISQAQMCD